MNHGDATGGPPLHSLWIHERRKPKGKEARVGELGTIAQCVAGDVVACESMDRKRIIWLEIAWMWPDGKAAVVRIYSRAEGGISVLAEHMREVQTTQRCRWLGLRAK